jgi:hypothetical protein
MMIGTAGAIAGAGSIGMVSASNTELDWSASLAPDPRIEGAEVEVSEVAEGMSDLDYVDNDGAERSLAEWGGILRPEAPSGEDDPNNPVSVRADKIEASTFTAYPRDVTDDNDDPISALDSANWSTSGMSVSDAGDALALDAGAAGDSATLDLSSIEGVIDTGIERRVLQTIANVSALGGSGIELSVGDGTNSVTETIASSVSSGIVTQTQLGELTGAGDLADISEITITAVGGSASLELHAFDIERESELAFGTQEITETNDDGDEETVEEDVIEPSGYYQITSLETLGSSLSGRVVDARFDVEFAVEELPSDMVETEFSDAPASRSATRQLDLAVEYQLPSAFDLEWLSTGSLMDTGSFPSGNYLGVELLEDADVSEIEDPFDLGDSASDVSGQYEIDAEVDLSSQTSISPAPGVGTIIHYSVLLSEDQESMLAGGGSGWFGAAGGSAGGDGGLLGSFRGFILMIAGAGGALIAWLRARGRTLTGGS